MKFWVGSWGIQARMNLLALGPASLIACLLVAYFTYNRIGDAEQRLRELGTASAKHIGASAEFSVITGNVPQLQKLVTSVVKQGEIQFAMVVDEKMNRLAQAGTIPSGWEPNVRQRHRPLNEQDYVFVAPIQLGEVELQDLLTEEAATNASQGNKQLGWAIVAMSRAPLAESKKQMLLAGLGIALAGLAITVMLAMRLGRSVSQPVRQLSRVVEELGQGYLGARVAQDSGGELLLLQTGVNSMAHALQTHQGELEQRIREATADLESKKEEAEQSNRAKSKFLASVSHDLRQPMHAIGLFSATLKHRVTTLEQGELVQRIEDAVTALQNMFDGLLNLSRLDSGMLEPNLEPCDLAALLKRIGQEFEPQAEQKGLQLRIRTCPAWVSSDLMLLGRMLGNLVANAIRYTEHGGVLISCRRRQGQWMVQIWDTGVGIPAEHLPHIFEEYYQVGNAERNSAQGVGLGLSIVSGIARLLDYRIEVFSRPGRGSVFNIVLPLATTSQINRRSSSERKPGQFNGEHVLMIEDDVAARESLRGLLSSWGLEVTTAADFQQAMACVEQNAVAPALIICDYRLPGKSGVEVVAALRAQLGTDVLAILISGDTATESVTAMEASGLPILYKPVRPAKLRALISSLLEGGNKAE